MQDYNYVHGSCLEITLELSCCKYPHHDQLPKFWAENKGALLAYLNEVHRGVRGLITDTNNNPIPNALLKINGRKYPFKASPRGEFWRILLPGSYVMEVKADGYQTVERSFNVQDGQITYTNIQLVPVQHVSDYCRDSFNHSTCCMHAGNCSGEGHDRMINDNVVTNTTLLDHRWSFGVSCGAMATGHWHSLQWLDFHFHCHLNLTILIVTLICTFHNVHSPH